MNHRPYFRFSLRSLLLLVAVAAVVSLWYRSHLAFRRSPSKTDARGGYRTTGDPQHLRTQIYRDHDDRLVAVLLLAFDELDVSGPRYQLKRGYNRRDGGWLILDGMPLAPAARPRVIANDPLGRLVELSLPAEAADDLAGRTSAAEIEAFYRESIEPLLVKAEGGSDAKGRQGTWTFRLPGGQLVRQVTYADGLRHGESVVYYQSGGKKCQAYFERGKPAGEWTLFDPDGDVLAIVDRQGVDPRGQPKSQWHVRRWESQINNERGYRLLVDGAELRLPP